MFGRRWETEHRQTERPLNVEGVQDIEQIVTSIHIAEYEWRSLVHADAQVLIGFAPDLNKGCQLEKRSGKRGQEP